VGMSIFHIMERLFRDIGWLFRDMGAWYRGRFIRDVGVWERVIQGKIDDPKDPDSS